MQASNPTAWEMPASRLVQKFAEVCAKVGSAAGVLDIMEGANRSEARYLAGVITARLLGKDKELTFRRGDGAALKGKYADSWHTRPGVIRLRYEQDFEEDRHLFGRPFIIPSDQPLEIRRVYFEESDFLLEFEIAEGGLTAPLLFLASDFLPARKLSSGAAR